jgi:hypothetical protein
MKSKFYIFTFLLSFFVTTFLHATDAGALAPVAEDQSWVERGADDLDDKDWPWALLSSADYNQAFLGGLNDATPLSLQIEDAFNSPSNDQSRVDEGQPTGTRKWKKPRKQKAPTCLFREWKDGMEPVQCEVCKKGSRKKCHTAGLSDEKAREIIADQLEQKASEYSSGSDRVLIRRRLDGKIIGGMAAPTRNNLDKWLAANPGWEVFAPPQN